MFFLILWVFIFQFFFSLQKKNYVVIFLCGGWRFLSNQVSKFPSFQLTDFLCFWVSKFPSGRNGRREGRRTNEGQGNLSCDLWANERPKQNWILWHKQTDRHTDTQTHRQTDMTESAHWGQFSENPAYGRQWISRPVRIVAPINFLLSFFFF